MPTLLQINECIQYSTGNIAQQIGIHALNNGWKSYLAYSSREKEISSSSELIRVGSRIDPYLHYLSSLLFDREGLASKMATKKLVNIIKDIKPDVVQLHNLHDHWLNYKILFDYLNSTNIKVVWTFHDCWAFTGHCFHFVTKGCERWRTECHNCPLQREYPKSYSDRSNQNFKLKKRLFAANKNLTVVACSKWMANIVDQSFLKEKRIEVIHNGIDVDVFKPSAPKHQARLFRVLAVSNVWNKEKGYYDILKLRELLPAEYEITLVGLTIGQQKGLPEGIKGIQRTQNVEEMVGLYSSSDVLINPTYADTFPTVNIEALACDTPVITYRTGGSPEIIDGKTGIVVERGDVQQLAQAIRTLKDNPIESGVCRDRAVTYYDKKERFADYISLYNNIIER